jgi:hypothetical protein
VAEQASSDWIEHDGAGCPVSDIARVQVQFRFEVDRASAEKASGELGSPAHEYRCCWKHQGAQSDITFYRIVA